MARRLVGSMYRLGELLGSGAMGDVYAAVGPSGEPVAIKFLRPGAAASPDLVSRFRREAQVAADITSPHVARVLGAGKDRDGALWIAFERLRGETLEDRLAREPVLAARDARWIVDHVLQGLAAAHAAGVVHRDVKPGNVFLDAGAEHARVLDFGVAKLLDGAGGMTTTRQELGTPLYSAPEQATRAADVDGRADLYAAAVVAFVCLAGRPPFDGRSIDAVMHHKLHFEPRTLAGATGTSWPPALERWIARSLARDREQRFHGAAEALRAWREAR